MSDLNQKKKKFNVSYETGTKSIMCRRFVKLGDCSNGNKCNFAHSSKELQFNSPKEWVTLSGNFNIDYREKELNNRKSNINKYVGESTNT